MNSSLTTLPAPADQLTPAQHAFVAEYIGNGGNASAAYRVAFGTNHAAVRVDAHRLLRSAPVAHRVAELRAIAGAALNEGVSELALRCFEVATASVADLQSIELYGCRHCWGAEGRYQWRDEAELADAVTKAAKASQPVPDCLGGFGYSSRAAVNPECEECRGHGIAVVRTTPTSELSAGARALYAGATVGADGMVRVLTEDRTKYAHMLHQLIGAYAPTRVEGRHAHLHVHKQAPDTRTPISVDEAMALLENPS